MYFIVLLLYGIIVSGVCYLQGRSLFHFDLSSLLIIFFLIVPLFIASGLGKEFNKVMKFLWNPKQIYSRVEYRKMSEAVSLLSKLSVGAGMFSMLIGLISLLTTMSEPSALGPVLAIMLTSLFYTVFIYLIMLPIQAKLKIKLMEDE